MPPPGTQLSLLPDVLEPTVSEEHAPLALEELEERARRYFVGARSPQTLRAYEGDWRRFVEWCRAHGRAPYPAEPSTVALYLTALVEQGRKVSTLRRARAAIGAAHRHGLHAGARPVNDPVVADVMRGIAREHGGPPQRAAAITPEQLVAMLQACGDSLRGHRDRALLALGFAGAFRRSTLVGLDVDDVAFVERGMEVLVRVDKSDPTRAGRTLPVAHASRSDRCPVAAVRAWITAAELERGPLFRAVARGRRVGDSALGAKSVDRVVKRAARAAGIEAPVSAHSLRAGFITAAVRQGHDENRIRVVSGHADGSRAFASYIRFAGIWDSYAGEGVL